MVEFALKGSKSIFLDLIYGYYSSTIPMFFKIETDSFNYSTFKAKCLDLLKIYLQIIHCKKVKVKMTTIDHI